ncbi:MAG TPA: helix-turn-helix domain-containing protein [Anaerolineae bacterium]|nr:helix-turn-helix domain-containing protein [Anaerolineae bacterium]
MKSLTGRQREFLGNLLTLYHQAKTPVHYSEVAERLDVAKGTAYEMLRLLEERGLLQAEYTRQGAKGGPGRSMVVFRPTIRATRGLMRLADGKWEDDDWEQAKHQILDRLQTGLAGDHEHLLDELLQHLPDPHTPAMYLTQMTTAIALGLRSLRGSVEMKYVRSMLQALGQPGELGLSALSGLGVGLSLAKRLNRRLRKAFLDQAARFHSMLAQLDTEGQRRLAQLTKEILDLVGI